MGAAFNKEKSFALLIGVGKREEDSAYMAITVADAQHLKWALDEFNILSNAEDHIKVLVDEGANKQHIIEELESLAATTNDAPADLVIIYFSGHGSKQDGKYHLICHDTANNDIGNTGIEGSVFVKKLEAIKCDKMLVLLDCCHAEGVTGREDVPFDKKLFLEQQKNRVVLTACHKSQVSYLSKPVSLFTYALIEGLGGKLLNEGDTEVGVFNLAMDVRERVAALSKEVMKVQQLGLKAPGPLPAHLADEVKKVQQPQLNVLRESGTTDFSLKHYQKAGPQEIGLFKEKFSALKLSNNKDIITTDVPGERDDDYRNQFIWMVTNNSIHDIGDGNYILQGTNINNGLTREGLKDLLHHLETKDKSTDKIIMEFISILKNKADNESKELLKKVEDVHGLIAQEIKVYENNLGLLLEKLQILTNARIISSSAMQKFELMKEIEQANKDIEEVKGKLSKLR